jgi:hypothetical protein
MRVLRAIGNGLVTLLGAVGVVILFLIVVIAIWPVGAGIAVVYMIFRPKREQELMATLKSIEKRLARAGY